MMRALTTVLGAAAIVSLSGCGGDTCESIKAEVQELGREILEDPEGASNQEKIDELAALQDKIMKMGCFGG